MMISSDDGFEVEQVVLLVVNDTLTHNNVIATVSFS